MSFLTSPAVIKQLPIKGKYKLCTNELFQDTDGSIYLTWRGFVTDNFTWLKTNKWDIRCSHLHDVGCEYHQIVKVNLRVNDLQNKGLLIYVEKLDSWFCKDIPTRYLKVVDVTKKEINDMFYRALDCADCPKTPDIVKHLYRMGVALNINWYFTGKNPIDLNNLYK